MQQYESLRRVNKTPEETETRLLSLQENERNRREREALQGEHETNKMSNKETTEKSGYCKGKTS